MTPAERLAALKAIQGALGDAIKEPRRRPHRGRHQRLGVILEAARRWNEPERDEA